MSSLATTYLRLAVSGLLGLWISAVPAATQTLRVKGSDTIGGELGPALVEAYRQDHPQVRIEWESLGSGTAFVGLFDGSADLGASSRPAKDSEVERAGSLGIQLSEFVLGYDGIAVIVHPSNPVAELTIAQLSRIFSGAVTRWSQVGGPELEIQLISRPSYSGTHGFFKNVVLRRGNKKGPEEFAASTLFVEETREIVDRVSAEPAALSYVGLGWVSEGVRAVPVAATAGAAAVAPTPRTVRDGTYPVFRPLHMYSAGEPAGLSREFLAFILSPGGQKIVSRHDFIPSNVPLPASGREASTRAASAKRLRIHFPFGGTGLQARDQRALANLARRLKAGGARVLVVGHSDSTGSRAVNLRVSEPRARAVAGFLISLGVPRDRLRVEGRGYDEPVATNTDTKGRRQNRRVEIVEVAAR